MSLTPWLDVRSLIQVYKQDGLVCVIFLAWQHGYSCGHSELC
jgi:hypothetical protein